MENNDGMDVLGVNKCEAADNINDDGDSVTEGGGVVGNYSYSLLSMLYLYSDSSLHLFDVDANDDIISLVIRNNDTDYSVYVVGCYLYLASLVSCIHLDLLDVNVNVDSDGDIVSLVIQHDDSDRGGGGPFFVFDVVSVILALDLLDVNADNNIAFLVSDNSDNDDNDDNDCVLWMIDSSSYSM